MAEVLKKKKKGKKRNAFIDWLNYLGLRVLVLILRFFNIETNLRTARFLGRMLWRYYHRGRKRAMDNLRASFPDKSEQWHRRTGRRSFEHMAMLAMDVLFTPRLVRKDKYLEYSYYKNVERAKWLMQEGKGLLMVAAHYSNFEILSYIQNFNKSILYF